MTTAEKTEKSEIDLTQNLSEILFKPQRTSLETSLISNSGCPLPKINYDLQSPFGFSPHWYRQVNRFYWTWLGGNLLDIEEALANIAVSRNPRSREDCLDTVIEYGPGNWIYEFNTIAQKRVLLAHKAADPELQAHHYRLASRYFAIAAYPYLKGDALAQESAVLCRRYYREVFAASKECGYYSEESFTYDGRRVSAYLHSPDNTSLHPCVVVLTSYEQSSSDYFRFFNDYLRPEGIAVLVLELPGQGNCAQLKLTPQSSDYIKAAVEHLKKLPFIDGSSIGLLARGIGAVLALRLCILEPGLIKGVALFNPAIDRVFTHAEFLSNVPLCLRSSFVNRVDLDASNWDLLIPRAQRMSLKKQGLLSISQRSSQPILCIVVKGFDLLKEDVKLIERCFKQVEIYEQPGARFSTSTLRTLQRTIEFFKENFS